MPINFEKEKMTFINEDGIPMGYITFPEIKKGLVNIDHVLTYPKFRGQGNADNMMDTLLHHLDEKGCKVVLTCSFAQKYVADHPEWEHLLPTNIHFEKK